MALFECYELHIPRTNSGERAPSYLVCSFVEELLVRFHSSDLIIIVGLSMFVEGILQPEGR